MRIAIFSDAYHPKVSGLVSSIDEFAHGLRGRGHEVVIVCPSYPKARMGRRVDGPGILRVPSFPALVSAEDRLAKPWKLQPVYAALKRFKPEIIHCQTEFSLGALGRAYARVHGLPIVSTCHTHYESYAASYAPFLPGDLGRAFARTSMRAVYRHDDYVVVPMERIARLLKSYAIRKDFHVIPTGIDEELFHPAREEARCLRAILATDHPRLAKGPLLLYAGRVGHEKNIKLLIDAMLLVLREFPEASLLVVGSGPAAGDLKHECKKRGLASQVILHGYVERERLPAYYSMSDVFTFPSVTETQGLVTIESMLCGTPVVGVAEMGTGDLMAGDRGGFLALNTVESFAAAILKLLRDPALRDAKAREAMEHARHWTLTACLSRLEGLYQEALAPRL